MEAFNEEHGAVLGQQDGVTLPLEYGDFAAETDLIRTGLGVLDHTMGGVLLVRGGDAGQFLNGLTTNNVKKLGEGRLIPDLMCSNRGRVMHVIDIARLKGDQYLVLTAQGDTGKLAGHLEGYHIREAVEFGLVPLVRIDLLGPTAPGDLGALGLEQAPFGRFQGETVLQFDNPLGGIPRKTTLLPPGVVSTWVKILLETTPGAGPVGYHALEEARIAAGIPRFGADFDADTLPAESGLTNRLSFDKGCYVGQEVNARLHWRGGVNRRLMGLELPAAEADAAEAVPGAGLFLGGQEAGRITSVSRLVQEDHRHAIAWIKPKILGEATQVSLQPDSQPVLRVRPLACDTGSAAG